MECDVAAKILLFLQEDWKRSVLLKYFSDNSHMHTRTQAYEVLSFLEELLPRTNFQETLTEQYEGRQAEEWEVFLAAELRRQWKLHSPRPDVRVQCVIPYCGVDSKLLGQHFVEKISCLYGRQLQWMQRQLLSFYPKHHDIQQLWSLHSCFPNKFVCFALNWIIICTSKQVFVKAMAQDCLQM